MSTSKKYCTIYIILRSHNAIILDSLMGIIYIYIYIYIVLFVLVGPLPLPFLSKRRNEILFEKSVNYSQ